ncbi:MAG: sigma-70 family RNA polymerase sigma factor [Lachnospiraceae bacterium]|nr:sigma-70 family RNA polymerase sigma factor [Lachnospiraceae bacterium]
MKSAKYDSMSDEAIIERIRQKDSEAIDYLMDKYKDMVRGKSAKLYLAGGERDDLIQEGMIGLFKAIMDFSPEKNASFRTFANLCVSRQMLTAIKTSNRLKNMPLNTYIPLYSTGNDYGNDNGEEKVLFVDLVGETEASPEEQVIDKENVDALENGLDRCLSSMEKEVLALSITGLSYVEIAEVLDKTPKTVDNALQRIKSKAKKLQKQ